MGLMHRSTFLYRGFGPFAAVLFVAALITAPAAVGATGDPAPAGVDETQPQQPTAGGGVAGTLGATANGGNEGQGVSGVSAGGGSGLPGAAGTAARSDSGGTLPFTGYPMTYLAWTVLGLVAASLAVRVGLGIYQRSRSHQTP